MARTTKKKENEQTTVVVTRAEKKDAAKNLIREMLAVKPYKHNELIEEGIATLEGAKLVVCEHELQRLRGITETVETPETINVEEISATVIEEAIETQEATRTLLSELTESFYEEFGAIRCDSSEEQTLCESILSEYYTEVVCEQVDTKYHVSYRAPKQLQESIEASDDTISDNKVD